MYDVIEVSLTTRKVRLIAENKIERTADAIVCIAVSRRGVDSSFFTEVKAGTYKDGDTYRENATD